MVGRVLGQAVQDAGRGWVGEVGVVDREQDGTGPEPDDELGRELLEPAGAAPLVQLFDLRSRR